MERSLFKKRFVFLTNKKKLYSLIKSDKDIYNFQLENFNKIWKKSYSEIPFYKNWKEKYNLPNSIKSLSQLKNFPTLTKNEIRKNKDLILKDLKNYHLTSTGGTSGITLNFPISKLDSDIVYVNSYLGRSWWGIKPFSKILTFWGHSHLFGKGFQAKYKKIERFIRNLLINTTQISSYNLDVYNIEKFLNTKQKQ